MFFDLVWYCRAQAPDRYDKVGSKAAAGSSLPLFNIF